MRQLLTIRYVLSLSQEDIKELDMGSSKKIRDFINKQCDAIHKTIDSLGSNPTNYETINMLRVEKNRMIEIRNTLILR